MILMTFLSLNQMLRAKEYISLLQFVISQQQTRTLPECFPVALAEIGRLSPTEHWPPEFPPSFARDLQVSLGTVSFCMQKHARSQTGEEEMEEVGSVPWSARDFPRDLKPDTLSSCISVLCL